MPRTARAANSFFMVFSLRFSGRACTSLSATCALASAAEVVNDTWLCCLSIQSDCNNNSTTARSARRGTPTPRRSCRRAVPHDRAAGCTQRVTNLPTARTHLAAGWLIELVWCKACNHQAPADLQAIIDAGQGDRPLKDLKFRCTKCGSSLTDHAESILIPAAIRSGHAKAAQQKKDRGTIASAFRTGGHM
jgi:hypothetical protein